MDSNKQLDSVPLSDISIPLVTQNNELFSVPAVQGMGASKDTSSMPSPASTFVLVKGEGRMCVELRANGDCTLTRSEVRSDVIYRMM